MAPRAKRRTKADRVADEMEARIRAGEWEPGGYIPRSGELLEMFGCGKAVLQQALRQLRDVNLIMVSTQARLMVVPLCMWGWEYRVPGAEPCAEHYDKCVHHIGPGQIALLRFCYAHESEYMQAARRSRCEART